MKWFSWRALPVLLVGLLCNSLMAEEASIREFVSSYVEAFNKQDVAELQGMWAEHATHADLETGERTEGREAIAADLSKIFEATPNVRLAGSIDRIRMVTTEVASVSGQTSVSTPDTEPAVSAFSAILVKKEGKWQIDSIEEMAVPEPPTSYDALKDLEWLVGRWVDDGGEARVETTVRWTSNRAFLIRSFQVSLDGEVVQEGTQVIGWDPRAEEIRSWKFVSDGSFGDGVWSRSEEDWLIKSTQTLADGQAASGTYVLTRVDDDTLTLRIIGHEVEGEPVPNSETITMVRVPEEPSTEEGAAKVSEESGDGAAKPEGAQQQPQEKE